MKFNTWIPIKGWEEFYELFVSETEILVRSLPRALKRCHPKTKVIFDYFLPGKIIKPHKGKAGYYTVALSKDSKGYTTFIHRIVADAFLVAIDGKENINHIDGNKLNNHPSNLEWCTKGENNRHAFSIGLIQRKLSKEDVNLINKMASENRSTIEMAKLFSVSTTTIKKFKRKFRLTANTNISED